MCLREHLYNALVILSTDIVVTTYSEKFLWEVFTDLCSDNRNSLVLFGMSLSL